MEIPKTFRKKELVKVYSNYALYVDPKTGFRECYHFDELVDKLDKALWIQQNEKAITRKIHLEKTKKKRKK